MIDKGNIPSIQCKMSPRGPKSMKKVDGLSLFIDFDVPVLTPRLNSTVIQIIDIVSQGVMLYQRLFQYPRIQQS
jgi:hypothetical protein